MEQSAKALKTILTDISAYVKKHPRKIQDNGESEQRAFAVVAHCGSLYNMKDMLTGSESEEYVVEDISEKTTNVTSIGHPLHGTYGTFELQGKDGHDHYTGKIINWSSTDHLNEEATTGVTDHKRTPEPDQAWMSRTALLGCSVYGQ